MEMSGPDGEQVIVTVTLFSRGGWHVNTPLGAFKCQKFSEIRHLSSQQCGCLPEEVFIKVAHGSSQGR